MEGLPAFGWYDIPLSSVYLEQTNLTIPLGPLEYAGILFRFKILLTAVTSGSGGTNGTYNFLPVINMYEDLLESIGSKKVRLRDIVSHVARIPLTLQLFSKM